jgi:hypothetical protein
MTALNPPGVAWYPDWIWGLPLIVLTSVIHIVGINLLVEKVERVQNAFAVRDNHRVVSVVIIAVALWLICVLLAIEALIWAAVYTLIGALPDYGSAVLYSLGAMTTYGHATLLLERRWQLLGALEALNGVLLFGVTVAGLTEIQRGRSLRGRFVQTHAPRRRK